MLFRIRVFLWTIAAELEYYLYPWVDEKPPQDLIQRYNLPESNFDKNLHYDWLKSHDEKINKVEENIIALYDEIHKLNVAIGTHD